MKNEEDLYVIFIKEIAVLCKTWQNCVVKL